MALLTGEPELIGANPDDWVYIVHVADTTQNPAGSGYKIQVKNLISAAQGVLWGGIGGTLSDQADLNTALNSKLSLGGGTLVGPVTSTSTWNGVSIVSGGSTTAFLTQFGTYVTIAASTVTNDSTVPGAFISDALDALLNNFAFFLDKAAYDPTGVGADVYDYANALGIEQITGSIITPPALVAQANNYNPTGFGTCNMIRQAIVGDQAISGFVAPPAGVNRIIHILQLGTSGDRIDFLDNDAGSAVGNRLWMRDTGDRETRDNETSSFWYDWIDFAWKPMGRIG